uniref:Uncharacterized protein n=1 Tax=Leersia perrieri TaxID=77586 RepID=A0A0D9VGA4_9ORYZ
MAAAAAARRRQKMVREGQRHLEEATAAAFDILSSIDHELSNPALWSLSQRQQQQYPPSAADDSDAASGGGVRGSGPGYGIVSLDEAGHCFNTAVAALRVFHRRRIILLRSVWRIPGCLNLYRVAI